MTKKWLETRRSYLEKLKSQSALISGIDTFEISAYGASNLDLYKSVWSKDSAESFFEASKSSLVTLCGDFHSSPAIKRFYIRLFRMHQEKLKKPLVMALECFTADQDGVLQKWLEGGITDEELLEETSWSELWGFSWKSYKKFILELKSLGFEFKAINSQEEDFKKRDGEIAKNLEALTDEGRQVFCFIGQMHLGPENLFSSLEELVGKGRVCSIHVDPEEIYFTLEEYNLIKEVQVLSLNQHFCFLSTPPWVHWQNHLLHLDDLYDYDEDDEDYEELRGEDYNVVVHDYVQLLKKDLSIPESFKAIDVAFIDEYAFEGDVDANLHQIMQPMLDTETSFYWPEQYEGIMILNSLNQAASVAGKYMHASLMGATTLPWGDPDSFEVWCWLEAVGHMLSKFINPKRTNVSLHNVSAFLSARLGKNSGAELLKKLIKSRVLELDNSLEGRQGVRKGAGLTWLEVIYASRLKGALVGERLFELYSKEQLSVETLRTYLSVPVDDQKRFREFYNLVLQRLEGEL